ncbi:SGNH/GDSL hydrolase family protein [Demequina phytophila]|uniref:SGNH/GDSL hydrolase family protein n=1 Tax=Demequina phytophila TaxID=1638981 RepID=UPI0007831A1B|nr:SGNH/GDSL hydrolase family protein [Demequina phytophila]
MARKRSGGQGWLARDHRGISGWGLLVAALVVIGIGGAYAYAQAQPAATAAPGASTSPVPSFSAPSHVAPIALFIGDSYTAGVGATEEKDRWSTLVSQEMGWREVNYGRSGTGYAATAGLTGCGRTFCGDYRASISEAVGDQVRPDIVVISGGYNDGSRWNDNVDQTIAAIDSTFLAARQAYPEAEIIAIGPPWLDIEAEWKTEFDMAVSAASGVVDGTFISLVRPPVLDDPAMALGDGAHVNDLGHQAIADWVIDQLS